jgi:hypothetical protein
VFWFDFSLTGYNDDDGFPIPKWYQEYLGLVKTLYPSDGGENGYRDITTEDLLKHFPEGE